MFGAHGSLGGASGSISRCLDPRDNDRFPFPGRTGQCFDRLHRPGLLALRCRR